MNEDLVKKRIELAKTSLVLELPLFAPLISDLKITEDKIDTMACSYREKLIVYNRDFVSKISNQTLRCVLLHEILHYLFIHDLSMLKDSRDRIIMNIVTDSLINYLVSKILNNNDFIEEVGGVTFDFLRKYVKEFKNLSDEELSKEDTLYLFRKLKENLKDFYNDLQSIFSYYSKNSKSCNKEGSGGGIGSSSNKEEKSNGEKEENESQESQDSLKKKIEEVIEKHFGNENEEIKEGLKKAIEESLRINEELESNQKEMEKLKEDVRKALEIGKVMSKSRGTLAGNIVNLIDIILKRKRKNWRKILRETFSEIEALSVDYDFTRRSRKADIIEQSLNVKTYIPALEKEDFEVNCIIGIDTSGSITDKEYQDFINEIYNLFNSVKNVKGYIVLWDATAQKVIEIKNGWNKEILNELKNRKGYGGTVIESFFKEAEKLVKNKKRNTFIIVLTDGYTEDVKRDWIKDYRKVVFVLSRNGSKGSLKNIANAKNVVITIVD